METKYKVGDSIEIVFNKNKKYVGKTGVIVNAIPSFDSLGQVRADISIGKKSIRNDGSSTTGFYKVKCDGEIMVKKSLLVDEFDREKYYDINN